MDGLECSEVLMSEIRVDNEKYRLDSDFFQKKYMLAYKKIKETSHSTIGNELEVLTDFHANGSYKSIAAVFDLLDNPDYAYMVRTTDLEKRDYIHNVKYISKLAYNFLKKSKIYGGEVIINKIGNPGKTFLMPHLNRPVSLGMNQFLLRMKKDGNIDNISLYLFLNSSVGKLLINRQINGTVPFTIDKKAVRSIYVPCLSRKFRLFIRQNVEQSDHFYNTSDSLYSEAVALLMDALGISEKNLLLKNTAEKMFSGSYRISGRLDAEYYLPKYDALFAMLSRISTKPLGKLVDIVKSVEPGSEYYDNEGVPFIRVSDISISGIATPSVMISDSIIPSISKLYPKKDTILFSKDGSVGIAYKLENDIEAVTSSALLHFHIKDAGEVLPDYLTLVLNSRVVQLQAERDASGSIIKHWKPRDIANVAIPILPFDIQFKISQKVQESFMLRRKAEKLVETAIRAIDIAIKQDEPAAYNYLHK